MRIKRSVLLTAILLIFAILSGTALAATVGIGLIYSKDQGEKFKKGDDPRKNYRMAIEANGARVVEFIQGEKPEDTARKADEIDGLVIPGGIDIDPKFYDEDRYEKLEDTDDSFDKFEMWILERADKRGIPVLGICRGHQLINVFFGGSMYQDVPTQFECKTKVAHRTKKDGKTVLTMHEVNVEKDSIFNRIMKKGRINVNSYHHQAVKNLAEDFKITARSDDGSVEAIESTKGKPILGVQFHPEMLRKKHPEFNAFFQWLIDEAKAFRQKSGKKTEKVLVAP